MHIDHQFNHQSSSNIKEGFHKRKGRKHVGGCPTQSPLFANIFSRLRVKIFPSGASLRADFTMVEEFEGEKAKGFSFRP